MKCYDEQLRQLQAQCARKKKLEASLNELRAQRKAYADRVEELRQVLSDEQADVQRLEGRSLAAFFYQAIGKMDEKLTKEQQEAYAAQVKYDAAARELEGVYPVDSGNLSTGIGHLVLDAGEMIKAGLGAEEIAEKLKERKFRVHSSFILDTLKFMSAGGRCSSITALGANRLNIKPCIEVDNTSGGMGVGKKYRGKLENVLAQYTREKLARYSDIRTDRIFITHSGIEESYIHKVRETIQQGAELLGWELSELLERTLQAMKATEADIEAQCAAL